MPRAGGVWPPRDGLVPNSRGAPGAPARVTAGQLAKTLETAVKGTTSVHIVVAGVVNGQKANLDFAGRTDGTEYSFSFSLGAQSLTLVQVDGRRLREGQFGFLEEHQTAQYQPGRQQMGEAQPDQREVHVR